MMTRENERKELKNIMIYMNEFIADYKYLITDETEQNTEINSIEIYDISCELETIESIIKDFRKHIKRREEGLE